MAKKPGPKGKTGPKKKPAPRSISTGTLADILGLTEARLSQLVALGLPKAGRGLFPTRDAVRWYVEFLRKGGEKQQQDGPTRADIARDMDALKLKKALGEVFDREEVIGKTTAAYTILATQLETLATRLGRELNLTGDDVKLVRDLVDEMRREFVGRMATFVEVVEAPDDQQQRPAA